MKQLVVLDLDKRFHAHCDLYWRLEEVVRGEEAIGAWDAHGLDESNELDTRGIISKTAQPRPSEKILIRIPDDYASLISSHVRILK